MLYVGNLKTVCICVASLHVQRSDNNNNNVSNADKLDDHVKDGQIFFTRRVIR